MNVFINDIPLIIKKSSDKVNKHHYDCILHGDEQFTSKSLVGHVLIRNVNAQLVDRLVRLMEVKKLKKLSSLTLVADKKKKLMQHVKDQFKIIKAAGGLVVKDGKILMIYRLKMWDLPKGKIKKSEETAFGALREVEEECNIQVEITGELPSTWHSYAYKGNKILKKTSWFIMNCLDDSLMKPQAEEFIEEVRWMTPDEVMEVLPQTYSSISFVIKSYLDAVKSGKV